MLPPVEMVGFGFLGFNAALPANWQGTILPGSNPSTYEGELGTVVIQDYRDEQWRIRLSFFHFWKKRVLRWTEGPWFRLQFSLQGNFQYKAHRKKFKVKQGTANAVWAPQQVREATFLKNQPYILFQALYAPELVQQLQPDFPTVSFMAENKTIHIEKDWRDTIQKILDAPYDEDTRRFFFENRVRDLLLYLLLRPGAGIRHEGLTPEVIQQVYQVDALILQDIKEWLRIPVLAKKVHLSEFKLKLAYPKIIGMGMFERLREARLQKAKQLLLDTDLQVKVIYPMVGYKSLAGFEDAFKEKFGLPALQYRKKYQLKD